MLHLVLLLQLMHAAFQLYTSSDGTVNSNGCTRSQTRTFTAIDACGNTSTASRTVTWTADLTPPSITTSGTTQHLDVIHLLVISMLPWVLLLQLMHVALQLYTFK